MRREAIGRADGAVGRRRTLVKRLFEAIGERLVVLGRVAALGGLGALVALENKLQEHMKTALITGVMN